MRTTLFALACGAALISATAVLADPPAPAATPVSATTTTPDNPVTCRVLYHEGAVDQNAKECHTKHQWEAMQRAMQHDISMDQQRSLQGGVP